MATQPHYIQDTRQRDDSGFLVGDPEARFGLAEVDGKYYQVQRVKRDPVYEAGYDGVNQLVAGSGTDDWAYSGPNGVQYLSDHPTAKLHAANPNSMAGGPRGRQNFFASADTGANDADNVIDIAGRISDADTLATLKKLNPQVLQQIMGAAGVKSGLGQLSADDVARIERVIAKPDVSNVGGEDWRDGEGRMAGARVGLPFLSIDPYIGGRGPSKKGEFFSKPENLKWSPEKGLYDDGSAGYVDRQRQNGVFKNDAFKTFMTLASIMVGGAAAAGAMGGGAAAGAGAAEAGAAGAAGGIGTGAELGFGGMLADSAATASTTAATTGSGFSLPSLSLDITGNKLVDSAITNIGKNVVTNAVTGNKTTPQGLIGSAVTGAVSGALPSDMPGLIKTGVNVAAGAAVNSALAPDAPEMPQPPQRQSSGGGNPQQVGAAGQGGQPGGFALGNLAKEWWG